MDDRLCRRLGTPKMDPSPSSKRKPSHSGESSKRPRTDAGKPRIASLDALRGLAALMPLSLH
eukprot:630537-Pleurochrysis_carterae.AAC.1